MSEQEKEKVERVQQNEVTQPKDGTDSAKVWNTATKLSEKLGRPARRKEVENDPGVKGVNSATFATQYARWVKFNGVGDQLRKQREEESAERQRAAEAAINEAKDAKRAEIEAKKKETEEKKAADRAKKEKEREKRQAEIAKEREAKEKEQQKVEAAKAKAKAKAKEAEAKAQAKNGGRKAA